jgi:hypothetical protein
VDLVGLGVLQDGGDLVERHGLAPAAALPAFGGTDQTGDVADDLVSCLGAADGAAKDGVDCLHGAGGEVVSAIFEPVIDVIGG